MNQKAKNQTGVLVVRLSVRVRDVWETLSQATELGRPGSPTLGLNQRVTKPGRAEVVF